MAEVKLSTHAVRAIVVTVVVLVFGAGYLAGARYFGHRMSQWRVAKAELAQLSKTVAEQGQQVVNLEMADKVNRLAEEKVRQRLAELESEKAALEAGLAKYRNLMESDQGESALDLESLTIRSGEGERQFRYDLVLRRRNLSNQPVEITLTLEIKGELHGIPFSIAYGEADPEVHEDPLPVTMKYFKLIQGVFNLPDHFVPDRVVVRIVPGGRGGPQVTRELPWKVATY